MPDIRWRGQDHKTLYDWINSGPGPTASTPQLEYWSGLKQSLTDISSKLNSSLHDIGATWEGAAGESAAGGLGPLQHWAEESLGSAELMSSSAQDQADNIATARAAMPAPQQVSTGSVAPWQTEQAEQASKNGDDGPAKAIAKQAADHEAQETAAADAHEQAIKVMSNYQAASEHNAATLGAFGTPPDLVVAVQMPDGHDTTSMDYAGLGSGQQHAQKAELDGTAQQPGGPVSGLPGGGSHGVAPLPLNVGSGGGTSAAAALGGVGVGLGVAGGVGAVRTFSRMPMEMPGGVVGVGPASAQGRQQEERVRPINSRPTAPIEPEAARPGPGMVPPIAGGGAGGTNNDETRGGNRYLNNSIRPIEPNGGVAGNPGGAEYLHAAPLPQGGTAGAGQPGQLGFGPGGPAHPGGAQFANGPQVTGGPGGPTFGPQQGGGFGGPGAMPPPGAGAAGGAGMVEEQHESASYLVEAVDVFDDGRMVAPSVLGGEEEEH